MAPIDLRDLGENDLEAVSERISREPERPLQVRVDIENSAVADLLAKSGFVEISRTSDDAVWELPPTLE